jgi:hypothetical protein
VVAILIGFCVALAVGSGWGLPNSDSWAADSISPRSCGLGAVMENFLPGHFHIYPPLHMALMTILSLPWIAGAALRAGTGVDALGAELLKPIYMTSIEVSARLLAAAMGCGVLIHLFRFWSRVAGRRVGIAAMLVAAANGGFVYYAHTGNLDVPYLFWITWTLVELDRVACGEPRGRHALLLAVAAVLTKDQAVGALILTLPVYLVVVPWVSRRASPVRRPLVLAAAIAIGVYLVGSGALENPTGFRRRVSMLLGPASQTWAEYPRGWSGMVALAGDAIKATTQFTSWPIGVAAAFGVGLTLARSRRVSEWRAVSPLLAALSFTVFFNLGARRADTRFLLPQSLLLLPYAAIAFEHAWTAWPRWRVAIALASFVAFVPAVLGVASVDATLLADPRYEAERYLAELPRGTYVEVYGGPIFLPRAPPGLRVVRPGIEPLSERQQIPNVTDIVDPVMDPRPRAPPVIVLATELSTIGMAQPEAGPRRFALMQYRDDVSRTLFGKLLDGSMGYKRSVVASCTLPWPLRCVSIHGSTAGQVWIYTRL